MNEVKSLLDHSKSIVGFDVKASTLQRSSSSGNIVVGHEILVLCVKDRCITILMGRLGYIPACLQQFLCDNSICFVGRHANEKIALLKNRLGATGVMPNGHEIAPFTARVLMNPNLKGFYSLVQLGKEIGLDFKDDEVIGRGGWTDWVDLCLSADDLLNAIDEAYKCFEIAHFASKRLPENRKEENGKP